MDNGDEIEYIAYLRQQVLVTDRSVLSFDEIALVEPGDEGTVFGDDQFWDYVVCGILQGCWCDLVSPYRWVGLPKPS
jgi:hypothetical protein